MWLGAGHYVCVTYYTRYAITGGFGIDKTFAGAFVSMNLVGYMLASLGPFFLILFPIGLILKASGKQLSIPANIFSAGWVADKYGPKYTLIMFNIMAIIGVINSAISIFYYIRVIKLMIMDDPEQEQLDSQFVAVESMRPYKIPLSYGLAITLGVILVIVIGIIPETIFDFAVSAIRDFLPAP